MKFKMRSGPRDVPDNPVPNKKYKGRVRFFRNREQLVIHGKIRNAALARGKEAVDRADRIQEMLDYRYGRGNKRVFTVKLGYNDHGLEEGQMIMEIMTMRHDIPADWGVAEWRRFMDTSGALPFRNLFKGTCWTYHRLLFAAEYLRIFETDEDFHQNGCWVPPPDGFDPDAEQVELDGRTWGGVDIDDMILPVEGEMGLSHTINEVKPVREQVGEQQAAVIEAHKNSLVPIDLDKVRELENDPELQKWEVAQGIARKPRSTWEGKLDFEMELRVKYCYKWLADIGEVPRPYPQDLLELFWPIMRIDGNDRDKERRNEVTAKLISFWRKSVQKNGAGIDLHSESYRVTLAAMELESLIEHHCSNYRRVDHENSLEQLDAESMGHIKQAAVRYFQAHFPVQTLGADPGPIATLDPPYVEYVRLCRKYNIKEGTLLHEALL
jgi:hypothetical protein